MDNKAQETFRYTYSAKQQEEIRAIRKKYAAPDEDKMAKLRRLDADVARKATGYALITGILGALVMGTGMSLIMTNLPALLGMSRIWAVSVGLTAGIVGIVLICCAYPVYNGILTRERRKIAPQILRLADELLCANDFSGTGEIH